jgi:hypothetical protein
MPANGLVHDSARLAELARNNLLGIFNERDEAKRLTAMESTYSRSFVLIEPEMETTGFEAISKIITDLLKSHPNWSFKPVGKVWISHNLVTLDWNFAQEKSLHGIKGKDVFLVDDTGKIEKLWVFVEGPSDVPVMLEPTTPDKVSLLATQVPS